MTQKRLKRCPFCGSRRLSLYETRVFWFGCTNCHAKTGVGITYAEAKTKWNRRKKGVTMEQADAYIILPNKPKE